MNKIIPNSSEVVANIGVNVDVYRIDVDIKRGVVGNTASGTYLFLLDQDVVHIDALGINTNVSYTLTDETLARGFSFTNAYVSDPKFQLIGPRVLCLNKDYPKIPDTISFVHSNTHASLISVSLQVNDSNSPEKTVAYDPQMTNNPGEYGTT
jgi:hypothetical protein